MLIAGDAEAPMQKGRYAWDYGHTFMSTAGSVSLSPKASVAGLSPEGDDATAWVVGHYVPVPAETGWTDGDLEDQYISARYRVYMNKAQYDRVMVFVRHLQASKHVWSAELYNCNAFVSDIAQFMDLRVPKSTLIYPKVFINNLRQINARPGMADNLVEQNLKDNDQPAAGWAGDEEQWDLRGIRKITKAIGSTEIECRVGWAESHRRVRSASPAIPRRPGRILEDGSRRSVR